MIKKFDVITKLYEEATQEVTESPEKWLAFLQSASKNYRLPFDEQLLIHMQRPEATAVLPMGKWNEKFGRWVKRDSKGIAVFDKSSDRLKLKYYFDVSDTREGKYKRLVRPVSLWSVSEEQQKSVKEALVNAFGVADGDRKEFAMVILEASLNIAEDNIGDYLQDILLATQDSPLEEMDKFNIRLKMKQLLANSISYMLFFRCGIKPEIYLETRDFQNIREFHTKELVNLFGVAASDMSEMALGEVADTIRKLQIQERKQRTFVERKTADYNVNNKQETTTERRQDNGSNHIQQQGDYLLPNLTIPEEEEVHLGKYAYLRNQYLMKNRYGMYLNLLTAGTLNQHLLQTEEEAQMRMETLIQQMAEKEGVTEELKARDQMEWIGRMNNIRQRAQEIVRNEILEN